MLKILIQIRLKGMWSTISNRGKKAKSNSGQIILYSILAIYFGVIFYSMFSNTFEIILSSSIFSGQWIYFAMVSIIAFLLSFVGSIFLAQQELYNALDNDLLLSLPIKERDILLSRVFSILILNYIYCAIVFLPGIVVYIQNVSFDLSRIFLFILTYLTLPFLILTFSCFFGWIIANIMKRLPHKNIFIFIFYALLLGGYFYVVFSGQLYMIDLLSNGSSIEDIIKTYLPPIYYLSIGISDLNIIDFGIYLLWMFIPFGFMVALLSKNFIQISTHKPKIKRVKYVEKEMKQNSITKALVIKECRHFTNNPIIMLNAGMGIIMSTFGCIGVIYLMIEKELISSFMIGMIAFNLEELVLVFGIIGVSFISSMNIISASSISLEGNRFWIVKSLPLKAIDILNAKLLFHILMSAPAGAVLSLLVGILLEFNIIDMITLIIAPILLSLFVAFLGLIVNLWKPKFDWINENSVVKQGLPVIITMFGTMGILVFIPLLYTVFESMMSMTAYLYVIMFIFVLINIGLYYCIKSWGCRRFEQIDA